MVKKTIILLVMITISMDEPVFGLRCFNCTSAEIPQCGDPFNSTLIDVVECKTSCFKKVKDSVVIRGCARTAASTSKKGFRCKGSGKMHKDLNCMCDYTGCNKSPRLPGGHALVWILGVVVSATQRVV